MLHVVNVNSDERLARGSLRHLNALQDSTNPDVNVLRRHVLGLHIAVRKGIEDGVPWDSRP
jgi:hypothetical protein